MPPNRHDHIHMRERTADGKAVPNSDAITNTILECEKHVDTNSTGESEVKPTAKFMMCTPIAPKIDSFYHRMDGTIMVAER